MRTRRFLSALLVAAAALLGTSIGALPASAAEPGGEFDYWNPALIEDQPWSSPAQPVECVHGASRIDCTPTKTSESAEQQCFQKVGYEGDEVVVCTSYPGNTSALETAGGEKLELMYACQFGDASCTISETFGRALAQMVMGNIAWALDSVSFNTSSALWTTVTGEWAWWMGVIIVVMIGASIVALGQAALTRDRHEIIGAFKRVALSWPLAAMSFWALSELLDWFDLLTLAVVDREGDGQGLYPTMQNLIFGGGGGNFWAAGVVMTFLNAAIFVLVFVLSFRNIALAALIGLGPIAFMMFPMKMGVNWLISWCSAVVALLLTGPLTLGFMMLVLNGTGNVDSLWSIQAIPLGIGLLMVSFTPLAVASLFSFAGIQAAGAIDAAGSSAGQTVKNTASRAGRNLTSTIKNRVGAARTRQARASSPSAPASSATQSPRANSRPSPAPSQNANPTSPPSPSPTAKPAPSPVPTPKPSR